MNSFYRKLNNFAFKSIAPEVLADAVLTENDFTRWKWYLKDQACELRLLMTENLLGAESASFKISWMRSMQQHVVSSLDTVNGYLIRQRGLWVKSNYAAEIRKGYIDSLNCLCQLLEYARKYHSKWFDLDVKMPDCLLKDCMPKLRSDAYKLTVLLMDRSVDQELASIVGEGIFARLKERSFTWRDVRYLGELIEGIVKLIQPDTAKLTEFLIEMNFNRPQFLLYLMNGWQRKVLEIEGLHEQLAHFIEQGGALLKIRVAAEDGFYNGNTLLPDLLKYCREQKAYLYELIELRRMERSDEFDAEKAFRILSHLTVPQLSLFMRMLVEKGIFATRSMAELYRFTAAHFYTEKARFISAQSMIRNGQEVDFATAYKLFQVLNGLIDWLDEKFSVRSYRPA